MPRLGGTQSASNGSLHDQLSKKLTFFGLVGVVMAALSFKERWDSYREVSSDSDSNPLGGPPAYRDSSDDENELGLGNTGAGLNTELPSSIRSRRRKSGCCVLCGVDCSILWKSIGIVLLLFIAWNGGKLLLWAFLPSPTGLEHFPEYSMSLGCVDAPFFWQGEQEIAYTIPVGSDGEHNIDISGGAGGTVLLAPSDAEDDTFIKVKTTVRASDETNLDSVSVSVPPTSEGSQASYFRLSTPVETHHRHHRDSCTRYDVVLYIPPNLKKLTITSRSTTQLKFANAFAYSPRSLDEIQITFNSNACMDLLLPMTKLTAVNTYINMRSGYLVGSTSILNSTTINTPLSSTITKLDVITHPYNSDSPAYLQTATGLARSDFTYSNIARREIQSTHETMGNGDLYLTYTDAQFNGLVDLKAKSYSAWGLQGAIRQGDEMPWVGDKDGADRLKVSSQGWVGLHF